MLVVPYLFMELALTQRTGLRATCSITKSSTFHCNSTYIHWPIFHVGDEWYATIVVSLDLDLPGALRHSWCLMKLLSNQGRGGEFVFDMLQLFLLAALLLLACSKQQLSLSHSSYSSSRFQFFCFSLLAAPLHPDPVLYFKATSVAAAGDI